MSNQSKQEKTLFSQFIRIIAKVITGAREYVIFCKREQSIRVNEIKSSFSQFIRIVAKVITSAREYVKSVGYGDYPAQIYVKHAAHPATDQIAYIGCLKAVV